MIKVTGMNHKVFIINADNIEKIESVPETLITLMNGNKYIVLETSDEIVDMAIKYKNKIFNFNHKIQ